MTPYYDKTYYQPSYDTYDKWELIQNNAWDNCTTTDTSTWISNSVNMSTTPMAMKVTTAALQTMIYDVKSVTIDVNQVTQAIDKAELQLRQAMKPQKRSYRSKMGPPVVADVAPRRPAPREFNKYINASDLVEEFIRYVGTEGVRQREVFELPIELFIKWLVIRACEEDAEEPNVTLELPTRKTQPRCLGCQRFMRRDVPVPIHDGDCATLYFDRVA